MRVRQKIRKLRGMLKGTGVIESLTAERARDCAKEDAAPDRGSKPAAVRGRASDGGDVRRVAPRHNGG